MLLSYRSVHSVQHILTDRLQLTNQPFGLCLTLDHELAVSGLAAIVRKAQKVEGLRATLPGSCSALGSEPPKLDQPGFALVDRQTELLQPVSECREELLPILFLLTADRQIVRIDRSPTTWASRSAASPTRVFPAPTSSGYEESMHPWLELPPDTAHFPQSRSYRRGWRKRADTPLTPQLNLKLICSFATSLRVREQRLPTLATSRCCEGPLR